MLSADDRAMAMGNMRKQFGELRLHDFYRTMHYSAKCGLAIVCMSVCLSVCLSVCPSVYDVGGSGPRRFEILESNCANN